jgi:hypothetical protein
LPTSIVRFRTFRTLTAAGRRLLIGICRCRDRHKKIKCGAACAGLKPDAVGVQSVAIQEFVVRERDGLWEVRLGGRLLSGQPTRREALSVAEALVHAAALRGERCRILAGTFDGVTVELEVIEPPGQPAADGS